MTDILHLGKFYPPDNGGIESVTASLARGAVAAGMEVTVLCFEERGTGDSMDCGVVIRRVPAIKVASQPLSFKYLKLALKLGRNVKIVHVHLPNMLAALSVILLGKGPKIVLHWHSDVIGKAGLALLTKPIEKLMLMRADKIICTSQAYADASAALKSFKRKIEIIPIGVPPIDNQNADAFNSQSPSLGQIRTYVSGRQVILALGRLVSYKGFSVLVEAAALMKEDAAIVIVGSGPLRIALEREIRASGVENRVFLAGRLEDAELDAMFGMSTLFCLPSIERSEAFGVVLVEAMARGLPIVATKILGSGVSWVNKDGCSGINVTPGSPLELAKALDQILASRELQSKFSAGAKDRYKDLFTLNRSLNKTLDMYDSLRKL